MLRKKNLRIQLVVCVEQKLNLTLYNVYNNPNPFQIYFSTKGNVDDSFIEIKENRDNLFPFLPTLNWLFSF